MIPFCTDSRQRKTFREIVSDKFHKERPVEQLYDSVCLSVCLCEDFFFAHE